MSRWKALSTHLVRLLKPSLPFTAVLALCCAPALFYLFFNNLEESAAAYLVYAASAYALWGWCLRLPSAVKQVRGAVYRHPLSNRWLTEPVFREQLSLHISVGFNLCYALLKLAAGVYYRSFWFGAIAVYYLILTTARALLLHRVRQRETAPLREYQTARLCGILLFALNIALSVVTLQMVIDGKGYEYPGYLIFVMAGYAFYSITTAIRNTIRFRKHRGPALSASRALGLATALVSMLSLQTAMFASFGGTADFQRLMNALTGGAVCLLIFLMAVWMVARTTRKIGSIKTTSEESI